MSLPRWGVENHVLANTMVLTVVVAGAFLSVTITREMFPESRPNKLLVAAVHPGVQPAEIEKSVTIKIEEAVRDVDGVEKVDSTVSEGLSLTVLTLFNEVKDVDAVLQEVRTEVDALTDLPDDVEEVTIRKLEPKLPVISAVLFGEGTESELKQAARRMRDDLLLLPGVSEVELTGTRDDEIGVEIRPERLVEYDLSFEQVAAAIRETNLDVSGGQLKGPRESVAVRTLGERTKGEDLADLVVRTLPDGRRIRLADVAVVRDGFVETDLESHFNGRPAVNCVVFKTGTQDVIQIAGLVRAYVAGKRGDPYDPYGFEAARSEPWYWRPFATAWSGADKLLTRLSGRPDPQAVYEASRAAPFEHAFAVDLHTDLSRFVEGRLDLMTRNGKQGLVLVLVSLALFLDYRVAFWAAVGMPVAFLGTFVVMWYCGVTLNLLSLFGLIIVLGIIVDDAIVVGDNVYRHVQEGMAPREAAIRGTEEVFWPVVVAVTTTIAAFAPLFFLKGQIGEFMRQLPIVVMAALSVSLVEALTALPAHLAMLEPHRTGEGHRPGLVQRFREAQEQFVQRRILDPYAGLVRFLLRWRYATICGVSATLLGALGLLAGGIVEWVLIQKMDSETIVCNVELPVGSTAAALKVPLERINRILLDLPEVKSVQTFVARQLDLTGGGSMGTNDQPHLGQLVVELVAADERETQRMRSSTELVAVLREATVGLPGVDAVAWEDMNGGPGGKPIEIRVSGPDFDDCLAVADDLKRELAKYAGVSDLDDDFDRGKREVQVHLRESARPTGITVGMLGTHVRAALYGREARRIVRNREDVRIMVRYPQRFRESVSQLESMWIPTDPALPDRGWVPLGEVARLVETGTFAAIHRSRQERSVTVYGELDDTRNQAADVLSRVRQAFDERIRPAHPATSIEFLGRQEETRKAFAGLKIAYPVALLMVYMLLAGLFRSYVQPLIVMSAIPFGMVGVIVGHWLTGNPFTILSGIGMVALAGMVVNDSLVLVDFVNERIRSGETPFEANVAGARMRLRAILLTTLTTVAGLAPMMFETSFQAKFLIPMVVTLTFGLSFATGLTLIVVPCLNMVWFDVRERLTVKG
jgi:multidrug efflux pump subunit AcrB